MDQEQEEGLSGRSTHQAPTCSRPLPMESSQTDGSKRAGIGPGRPIGNQLSSREVSKNDCYLPLSGCLLVPQSIACTLLDYMLWTGVDWVLKC